MMTYMEKAEQSTESPELAEKFNRVLQDAVAALEESKVRYAFIGGVASGGLGRPRSTRDIDVFVRPEDAELTLRALAKRGFQTEKRDPSWLYKGYKDGILVDVIFKSKGEIYLDDEMYARSNVVKYHDIALRLVAPEDLTIIKASAHSELCPGHWHDALALLSHANIDWDYLIQRARRAPRRVLSLLIYAHSNDIWVPKEVIDQLFNRVYGDSDGRRYSNSERRSDFRRADSSREGARGPRSLSSVPGVQKGAVEPYAVAHLRERLAQDSRTHELDIQIEQSGNKILLQGVVNSEERKRGAEAIAREMFPRQNIENQLRVMDLSEPAEQEEVS